MTDAQAAKRARAKASAARKALREARNDAAWIVRWQTRDMSASIFENWYDGEQALSHGASLAAIPGTYVMVLEPKMPERDRAVRFWKVPA